GEIEEVFAEAHLEEQAPLCGVPVHREIPVALFERLRVVGDGGQLCGKGRGEHECHRSDTETRKHRLTSGETGRARTCTGFPASTSPHPLSPSPFGRGGR